MTLQLQPVLRSRRRARTIERVVYAFAGVVALAGGALLAAWTNGELDPPDRPEDVQAVPAPSRVAPSVVLVAPQSPPEAVPRVAPPEIRIREAPGPAQTRTVPAPQSTAPLVTTTEPDMPATESTTPPSATPEPSTSPEPTSGSATPTTEAGPSA